MSSHVNKTILTTTGRLLGRLNPARRQRPDGAAVGTLVGGTIIYITRLDMPIAFGHRTRHPTGGPERPKLRRLSCRLAAGHRLSARPRIGICSGSRTTGSGCDARRANSSAGRTAQAGCRTGGSMSDWTYFPSIRDLRILNENLIPSNSMGLVSYRFEVVL